MSTHDERRLARTHQRMHGVSYTEALRMVREAREAREASALTAIPGNVFEQAALKQLVGLTMSYRSMPLRALGLALPGTCPSLGDPHIGRVDLTPNTFACTDIDQDDEGITMLATLTSQVTITGAMLFDELRAANENGRRVAQIGQGSYGLFDVRTRRSFGLTVSADVDIAFNSASSPWAQSVTVEWAAPRSRPQPARGVVLRG